MRAAAPYSRPLRSSPPTVPAAGDLGQRPPRGRHRRDRAEQLPLVAHHPEIAHHPGPSAIAHARSETTRPRSWPPGGGGSAADSPDVRPVRSASWEPLPPRPGPARRYMRESALLTGRGLRTIARVPARLSDVTLQPVVFTLPFLYVFGSAIHVPGMRYQNYLIPRMIAQTVAFGVISSGVATATDFRAGVIDRFTSLPVTRLAVITAQLAGQMIEQLIGMIIVAALGLALGWRPHLQPRQRRRARSHHRARAARLHHGRNPARHDPRQRRRRRRHRLRHRVPPRLPRRHVRPPSPGYAFRAHEILHRPSQDRLRTWALPPGTTRRCRK